MPSTLPQDFVAALEIIIQKTKAKIKAAKKSSNFLEELLAATLADSSDYLNLKLKADLKIMIAKIKKEADFLQEALPKLKKSLTIRKRIGFSLVDLKRDLEDANGRTKISELYAAEIIKKLLKVTKSKRKENILLELREIVRKFDVI